MKTTAAVLAQQPWTQPENWWPHKDWWAFWLMFGLFLGFILRGWIKTS